MGENFTLSVRTFNTKLLPEDKWLLVGLPSKDTKLYVYYFSTTRIRKLNHIWDAFLTEKADFSKWNILMLTIIN